MESLLQNILIAEKSDGYELLDSGGGQKLERFGNVVLARPDPQVLWQKSLPQAEWDKVDAVFTRTSTAGKWKINTGISKQWQVSFADLNFLLELLPSKHVGLFPEQSSQWKWLSEKIKTEVKSGKSISILNLFGYTGGATLACSKAGANVCHVDSSQFAVDLAMKNRDLSGLSDKPIRFIVDDARKFVEKEIKRENKYDVIVLDPPVYGKGEKKQVWKIEEDLLPLLSRLKNILSPAPLAVVLNGYASGYSHVTYGQVLASVTPHLGGKISSGELAIKESSADRLLTAGIFARWEK